jgi:hypothetical protein
MLAARKDNQNKDQETAAEPNCADRNRIERPGEIPRRDESRAT